MLTLAVLGGATMLLGVAGLAQTAPEAPKIITPPSGIETPGDVGKRAHTNVEIFEPNGKPGPVRAPAPLGTTQPGAVTTPGSAPPGLQGANPRDGAVH